MTKRGFASWGRYPHSEQSGLPLHWRSDIASQLKGSGQLAWGNGRSYGDVCQASSGRVMPMRALNRLIDADWETGVLRSEAGATLEEILAVAIPKGWFLPVLPGTQQVTLGGAVANDVHGKNHHRRGTFGSHVVSLELYRTDRGLLNCSRINSAELFNATIGGLGLTGIIGSVEVQLQPLQSSNIDSRCFRFQSLAEFLSLCEQYDTKSEYSVAWLDCTAKDARGVFSCGNHADDGAAEVAVKGRLKVPFAPPLSPINRPSVALINRFLYRWQGRKPRLRQGYRDFLCPLDGIAHWNRAYGRAGFQQYQCVIPRPEAEAALEEILARVRQARQGSFMSVLKVCGKARSPGLLSFPLPGISLALDFPQRPALNPLFRDLDAIVSSSGGRLYPAKDAHMSAEHFQQGYPRWAELESLRDPALLSRFWQRVTDAAGCVR
ncbi:MAG: FAD-binding oxidoreductase [Pseudomonadota bacterium]